MLTGYIFKPQAFPSTARLTTQQLQNLFKASQSPTDWQAEEITQVKVIDPLVDIAQKAFALLGEGSDIASAFVTSELANLLEVDESGISWRTPEWQKVQDIVRSLV